MKQAQNIELGSYKKFGAEGIYNSIILAANLLANTIADTRKPQLLTKKIILTKFANFLLMFLANSI